MSWPFAFRRVTLSGLTGRILVDSLMILKYSRRTFKKKLEKNEKVEADGIYRGVNGTRSKGDFVSRADQRAKSKARGRHETVNGRIKNWACLRDVWRHPLDKHKYAFAAVVVITQITFNIGEAPNQCHY